MFVTPADASALLVLAGPLTVTIFDYGRIRRAATCDMATLALMAYSLGLLGFSMVKVLAPGYLRAPGHAHAGAHRHAVARRQHGAATSASCCRSRSRTTSPGLHALLALNNGIGAWYNSTMLYRGLRRQGILTHAPGWKALWVQSIVGNLAMVAFLWWFAGDAREWLDMRALERAGRMSILVGGGAVIYFGTMVALGLRVRDLKVQPAARSAAADRAQGADSGTGPGTA